MSVSRCRWDLNQFREAAAALFGVEQLALLRPCLRSLQDRSDFAHMQYRAAVRLCEDVIADHKQDDEAIELLAFGASDDADEFLVATRQAWGHIVAVLESLNAMSDTLGHVVYFGLGVNLDAATRMSERAVTLSRVVKNLEARPDLSDLAHAIDRLTSHEDYIYVSALTNHCKHRSVVGAPYTFNLVPQDDGGYLHGLQFAHFRYDRKLHPPRWVSDVLPKEYARQVGLVDEIGVELNRALDRWRSTPRCTTE